MMIMNAIKKFLPPIVLEIYRNFKPQKDRYQIGKYTISIPPKFALPLFQKHIKLYDRFLPVLAKNLPADKIIIDVGANIGDTTIALLQHCTNPIICFEPSNIFFPYLEKNLKNLDPIDSERVTTFKNLVGTGLLSGELEHNAAGTANIKVSENLKLPTHSTLDSKIADSSNVVLIKVDTDGFDFDVIQSAEKICAESEPLLFWENLLNDEIQLEGFPKLYTWLEARNYKYVYIFDNFGNLITEEIGYNTLRNLNTYLHSMNANGCTRTFSYVDVLASTEKYQSIARKAIDEYKQSWILSKVV